MESININVFKNINSDKVIVFCNNRISFSGDFNSKNIEGNYEFLRKCAKDVGFNNGDLNVELLESDISWFDIVYHKNPWEAFCLVKEGRWNKSESLFEFDL